MNKDILKGNWKQLKGKIKAKWGSLTDDDITRIEGSYDQLEGLLQKRYGYQKDRIETEVTDFLAENGYKDKETTY